MSPTPVVPGLYRLALGGVNAYLIIDTDGLALIDTGYAGSANLIAQHVGALGYRLDNVTQIVVTHCHADHAGSLAELQQHTGAPTWMHPLDAELVRVGIAKRASTRPTPGLVNRLIYHLVIRRASPTILPARVDTEVGDGTWLRFAGGLQVLHVPGHSAGQIALLWPRHGGVLIAADTAINVAGLGLFPAYEDLPAARRSLAQLGTRAFSVACFGHGRPIMHTAASRFRARWGASERGSRSIRRNS